MELGRLGVWSIGIRQVADPAVPAAAAELEQLGYGSIWYSGGSGTRGFDIGRALLQATSRITIATGITSIWATTPAQSAAGFGKLEQAAPGRFLLGLGVSHAPMVNHSDPGRYRRPLQAMASYLDDLTAVPGDRRILAALGPKMLDLAALQSLGTHPYLVTPQMTAHIRAMLPPGFVVAVEQGVVLETDPGRARAVAREHLSGYLGLPNYANNWLRSGYEPEDVSGGGSDRLVDDLVAWGDAAAVADRIQAHYAAGADHVCVQVLGGADPVPLPQWQAIATEVLGA
ncbi:MAG TPA: LLM class F420-dependent oxidoreductase [Actinospica sp.]|jgi:probable F420-dependent oxidoreductase|nr:LLM class F420-dependent oxidoreductase [Actinospica sp.]